MRTKKPSADAPIDGARGAPYSQKLPLVVTPAALTT